MPLKGTNEHLGGGGGGGGGWGGSSEGEGAKIAASTPPKVNPGHACCSLCMCSGTKETSTYEATGQVTGTS